MLDVAGKVGSGAVSRLPLAVGLAPGRSDAAHTMP
jgi:hypothetical protein